MNVALNRENGGERHILDRRKKNKRRKKRTDTYFNVLEEQAVGGEGVVQHGRFVLHTGEDDTTLARNGFTSGLDGLAAVAADGVAAGARRDLVAGGGCAAATTATAGR